MDLIRDFFESKARIEISPRLVFLQRLDLCDRHSSGPKVAKTPLDQTGGDSLASLIRIDGEIDDPADARNFAVGLLTAIAQLERENEVQDSDPIPQDYSDIAIGDWDEVVRYGLVRREDPEGESTP